MGEVEEREEPPLPLPCPRARATPPRSLARTRRPLPLESGRVRRGREEEGESGLRCLQDRPLLTIASMNEINVVPVNNNETPLLGSPLPVLTPEPLHLGA